ncbi:MAG: hypothetical protein RLZZ292_2218, partial [Bacteroidota bacterium]
EMLRFAPGNYILHVQQGDSERVIKKLIRVKEEE